RHTAEPGVFRATVQLSLPPISAGDALPHTRELERRRQNHHLPRAGEIGPRYRARCVRQPRQRSGALHPSNHAKWARILTGGGTHMTQDQPGFFETIYTARALRRFKPDPIPDEVLFQAFDAAIRAPSGQNRQDWRWVIITDPEVKAKMGAWAKMAWERYQPEYAQ